MLRCHLVSAERGVELRARETPAARPCAERARAWLTTQTPNRRGAPQARPVPRQPRMLQRRVRRRTPLDLKPQNARAGEDN